MDRPKRNEWDEVGINFGCFVVAVAVMMMAYHAAVYFYILWRNS